MKAALYLHFPFCVSRCAYCDFNAYAGLGEELRTRYLEALLQDIRATGSERRYEISTVFMGGGTPSLFAAGDIARVLQACRESFDFKPGEVTIEANPGTVSAEKLAGYRQAGVNRLSLGAQSFRPQLLAGLNRIHSAQEVEQAVQWAVQAGFNNYSLDLIYGLPGQTPEDWHDSLERALVLQPRHVSIYQLTVEPGTPLEARLRRREVQLPEEDSLLAMDGWMRTRLHRAGFHRYEISNWCLPGYHCRHNRIYWQDRPYLGLGCGATGFVDGWRMRRLMHPAEYAQAVEEGRWPLACAEKMGHDAAAKDALMMGFRTCWGVNLRRLARRFPGISLRRLRWALAALPAEWLEFRRDWVRLTPKGADFATSVQHHLMDVLLTYHRAVDRIVHG